MARKYNSYSEAFENIADAIRRKSNIFDRISVEDMPERIKDAGTDGMVSFGAITNSDTSYNKTAGIYTVISLMVADMIEM